MSRIGTDIDSIQSQRYTGRNSTSDDMEDPFNVIPVQAINSDVPKQILKSRDLSQILNEVKAKATGVKRLPMNAANSVRSVRILSDRSIPMPESPYASYVKPISKQNSRVEHRSAKSYIPSRPDIGPHKKPDKNLSSAAQVYIWRQKFITLNAQNPSIPIPDFNDPHEMECAYREAMRTNHYTSTNATWLLYMGLGYGAVWYALSKMGLELPGEFIFIQLEIMNHYPQILMALGDPGGISLGSSWPPWLKLTIVICLQTIVFVIVYKISNSVEVAHNTQKVICGTGILGGTNKPNVADVDTASMNIMGLLGNMFGGNGGGGGGLQSMIGNIIGAMGGNRSNPLDDIDLDAPNSPLSERDFSNSRRDTPYD
jgi:hypothetical protein